MWGSCGKWLGFFCFTYFRENFYGNSVVARAGVSILAYHGYVACSLATSSQAVSPTRACTLVYEAKLALLAKGADDIFIVYIGLSL